MNDGQSQGFKCPVCGSQSYVTAMLPGEDGKSYPINFYKCSKCSFGFKDPSKHAEKGRNAS